MQKTDTMARLRSARRLRAATRAMIAAVTLASAASLSPASADAAGGWRFSTAARPAAVGAGGVGMVLDGGEQGVVVARVVPGGPAASAGVRPGDRIVRVGGRELPPKVTVAAVAGLIRGAVGTRVELHVQGKSDPAPRAVQIERVALEALFPSRVAQPVLVGRDAALIASASAHTVGVRFLDDGRPGELLRYEWAIAPAGATLDHADASSGQGAVTWTGAGATIQIADWRLDLAPWPARRQLVATAATAPVVLTDAAHWRSLDPSAQKVQTLRAPPKAESAHWGQGPCTLTVQAKLDGAPQVLHRLTLQLRSAGGQTMPTETALTNADGEVTLQLPASTWSVTGLEPAKGGGHRDLAFKARLKEPPAPVRCEAGAPARLDLALEALPADKPAPLPSASLSHPLVGKPLPEIAVRRWLGDEAAPSSGQALMIYAWATWCGPCKRTSPEIAELAARRAGSGLRVVLASADRDEAALEDYAAALPPDGPSIAWCGPDVLETLEVRGIPSVVVVDAGGVVRAVHTGTGVSIASWEAFLDGLTTPAAAKEEPAAPQRKTRPSVGRKR